MPAQADVGKEVDVEGVLPLLVGDVPEVLHGKDANVVDQHIQRPLQGVHRIAERLGPLLGANVTSDANQVSGCVLRLHTDQPCYATSYNTKSTMNHTEKIQAHLNLFNSALDGLLAPAIYYNKCPGLSKFQGHRLADARRAARHHNEFVLKIKIHIAPAEWRGLPIDSIVWIRCQLFHVHGNALICRNGTRLPASKQLH